MDVAGATAPAYSIPARRLTALEHPALLTTLDRGIDTLGLNADYRRIVKPDGPQSSVPIFLRYEDPSSSALGSHNAASHNIVLAVTVPRRTGRKRKRGSLGPWEDGPSASASAPASENNTSSSSETLAGATLSRRDPLLLRRSMRDNVGKYKVDVVGLVNCSHRYRGLFDFHQSVHDSHFMTKFTEKILPGELSKIREFELTPGVAAPPNVDIMPPPFFTTQTLPFSYFYSQNPFVREVSTNDGAIRLVNSTVGAALGGYFLKFDAEPVPTEPPPSLPPLQGRRKNAILSELRRVVEERPVWTRRGLVNHMSEVMGLLFTENRLKTYFAHVCYQFKGGPWRDTLIRYGFDPRKDAASGKYQTMLFKLQQQASRKSACWHSIGNDGDDGQTGEITTPITHTRGRQDTHIFDGRSYCDDGKIWQVCDIIDPVLAGMLASAPRRPTCDVVSTGWYHQGTWAKAKAIMKAKLLAIRFGRDIDDEEYRGALAVPDETPRLGVRSIKVPVPDLQLTPEEEAVTAVKTYHGRPQKRMRKRGTTSVSVPIEQQRSVMRPSEPVSDVIPSTAASVRLADDYDEEMENIEEEEGEEDDGDEGVEEEEEEEDEDEDEDEDDEEEDDDDDEEEDEDEDEDEDENENGGEDDASDVDDEEDQDEDENESENGVEEKRNSIIKDNGKDRSRAAVKKEILEDMDVDEE